MLHILAKNTALSQFELGRHHTSSMNYFQFFHINGHFTSFKDVQ